ncbi:WSC domain-containing protein [Aspergillus venezuelensis]
MHFLKMGYILPFLTPTIARTTLNYLGCYADLLDFENIGTSPFLAVGLCKMRCERRGDTIMGLRNGTECWCGNEYPSWEDGLDEEACHLRCPGYARDICGGHAAMSCYEIQQEVTETTYSVAVELTVWPTLGVAQGAC